MGSVLAGVQLALQILNFLLICRSEDVNRTTDVAGMADIATARPVDSPAVAAISGGCRTGLMEWLIHLRQGFDGQVPTGDMCRLRQRFGAQGFVYFFSPLCSRCPLWLL